MDYLFHILILILIYSILAMSLNLVLGHMGIISVAHGALFGIGAYLYAILTMHLNFHPLISLILCSLFTSVIGLFIAFPSLKMKGDYLALATFGFAIVAYDLFNNLISITKGPMGIPGIKNLLMNGSKYLDRKIFFLISLLIATLVFFLIKILMKSPWGRIVATIRERENVLPLTGKNPVKYKLITFTFAAFWAGVAGALYASYLSYIHPSNFVPMVSILILCMVVIGGMGNTFGSILGAIIFISIPEILRFVNFPDASVGILNELIFGLILIVFMLSRPQGLLGKYVGLNQ